MAQAPPALADLDLGFEPLLEQPSDRAPRWSHSGEHHRVRIESKTPHGGTAALEIHGAGAPPATFGAVKGQVPASALAGRRVRYGGWVRADQVRGHGGLWCRAEGGGQVLAFDNMRGRELHGTHAWQRLTLTLEVPRDSDRIAFGAFLAGDGTLWVDDLAFEDLGPIPDPVPAMAATGGGGVTLFFASLAALRQWRPALPWVRLLACAAGIAIAVVGVAVAALAPATWFDWVLAHLIGSGGPAETTGAQRVVAAAGAAIGGLTIARWSDLSSEVVALRGRARLAIAAVPWALLVAENAARAGVSFGFWSTAPRIPSPYATVLAALLIAAASLVLVEARAASPRPDRRFLLAAGAGAAYGCFSALWHCCPPLWSQAAGSLGSAAWLAALAMGIGAIGRVGASCPAPRGELMGAVLFALFYPWHTPAWFAQCLIAGALATWMVRRTGSGWAPALAGATAYATHMTLPFIGWAGAAVALVLLLRTALSEVRWRHALRALAPG